MLDRRFKHSSSDTLLSLTPSPSPHSLPESLLTLPSDLETLSSMAHAALGFEENISFLQLARQSSLVCESFDQALKESSTITMLPNYEISPSGNESGEFLVIDLGGLTLRVAVISIAKPAGPRQSRISIVTSKSWTVENSCKVVDQDFFRWMAGKISETLLLQKMLLPHAVITTGITWSFPLQSTSYNTANIFHMGKGYSVDDAIVGCDLKLLLELTMQESFGIRLDVQSIINDSLAVFSAARFFDPDTMLAMVLGTGLNFCCQLAASLKIASQKLLHKEKYVLFNTETSLFGHSLVAPFATKYDCIIDRRFGHTTLFMPHMEVDPATNTIFQPFELLASGRYLPELARLVVMDVIAKKEIFASQENFDVLKEPYQGFTGELLCFICECADEYALAERIESCFNWRSKLVSISEAASLKTLVVSIVRRLAFIVAIAIVAFIKLLARHNGQFEGDVIAIGYVGSVMEYFGHLRGWVLEFVNECADMKAMGVRIKLQPVNESSLVGTAIAAASQLTRCKL